MKLIIAAICSLALTITGILGVNQLTSDRGDNIDYTQQDTADDKVQDTEDRVNQDAGGTKEQAAPAEDVQADDSTDNEAIKAVENDTKKAEDKRISKTIIKTEDCDTAAPASGKTAKDSKSDSVRKNTTNSKSDYAINELAKNSRNGKAYIYKIDLSGCNSYSDVADKLNESGYYDLDARDLKKIGSLDDILKIFGGNSGKGNGTQTTVPTKPSNTTPSTKPSTPTPTPTPKPSAPTPTPKPSQNSNNTSSSVSSYANQVLQLVNAERAKAGLSPFATNSTLEAAADKRAQETSQSFSHTRPDGTKFSTVLQEYGISYRTAGENIAYGQRTPQEVVNGWMNSPGHRANILNAGFNKIGIGVYQKNGVIYWSQLFTN
jgi:uncharacterized protein YkwD